MAKALQKYILSLAQQVATDQGRPLVISQLVARLHRRLQNNKPTEAEEANIKAESDASEEEEEEKKRTKEDVHNITTSSSEDDTKGPRRRTRAQKKQKRVRPNTYDWHIVYILSTTLKSFLVQETAPI